MTSGPQVRRDNTAGQPFSIPAVCPKRITPDSERDPHFHRGTYARGAPVRPESARQAAEPPPSPRPFASAWRLPSFHGSHRYRSLSRQDTREDSVFPSLPFLPECLSPPGYASRPTPPVGLRHGG